MRCVLRVDSVDKHKLSMALIVDGSLLESLGLPPGERGAGKK
jgi:hypothetical protein